MKGLHWIDLGPWPPALAVTFDKRAYRRFMRERTRRKSNPFPGALSGYCELIDSPHGIVSVIIAIGDTDDPVEVAALMAHEATHAARFIFERYGEDEPGKEAQAYLVEHIVRGGLKARWE